MLQSLDPRINRMGLPEESEPIQIKVSLDQFQTYEVFHQKRENTPYTYVGPVHAPKLEVAFLYAKEQYSRRATCTGLWVVATRDIQVTPYGNDHESVYATLPFESIGAGAGPDRTFEVFHLKKRGKAHAHMGTVVAPAVEAALWQAREQFSDQGPCVNVWLVPADRMMRTGEEWQDMWQTTADKKYREPTAYKVQDKIAAFKNQSPAI